MVETALTVCTTLRNTSLTVWGFFSKKDTRRRRMQLGWRRSKRRRRMLSGWRGRRKKRMRTRRWRRIFGRHVRRPTSRDARQVTLGSMFSRLFAFFVVCKVILSIKGSRVLFVSWVICKWFRSAQMFLLSVFFFRNITNDINDVCVMCICRVVGRS